MMNRSHLMVKTLALALIFLFAGPVFAKKKTDTARLRAQLIADSLKNAESYRSVGDCKTAKTFYQAALRWTKKDQRKEIQQKIDSCTGGTPIYNVPLASHTPCVGPKNTYVTIVEFSDFQCPFCSRAANTIKKIREHYKGQVRVCFVNLPLAFHKKAFPAALAAMAAHRQGLFWEYHDELFRNYRQLGNEKFLEIAKRIKLSLGKFETDRYSAQIKRQVRLDMQLARRIGARGTPSFFINGVKLVGAQPFYRFKKTIDQQILRAKLTLRRGVALKNLYSELIKGGRTSAAPYKRRSVVYKVPLPKGVQCKGAKRPLVTIVEFSEFQCPYCVRAQSVMNKILETWPKQVRVCFVHYPLPFHRQAFGAAIASMAAAKQRKFWKYHDLLFQNQRTLSLEKFMELAKQAKLNIRRFTRDLKSKKLVDLVNAHMALARKVGVRGTPNFFINGVKVTGARPFASFKPKIEAELLRAKTMLKKKGVNYRNLYAKLIEGGREGAPKQPGYQPKGTVFKVELPRHVPCKGPKNALVTIVEFSDFQCPFCARAISTLKQISDKYRRDVRICYVNNPLPFHKKARPAALAALAALKQGKFWQYHDKLFENWRKLSNEKFIEIAMDLKLNIPRFKRDIQGKHLRSLLGLDQELAQSVGARGTPNFFINGVKVVGARPFQDFQAVIEQQLKRAKKMLKKRGVNRRNLYKHLIKGGKSIGGAELKGPKYNMQLARSPFDGPRRAKVTLVVFSDFQCPFCSRFAATLHQLRKMFPRKLKIVYKNFPLSFHVRARPASIAALAAARQGKFWRYHDLLYQNQRRLTDLNLLQYADKLGLNVEKFKKDLKDPALEKLVNADLKLGMTIGVRGTPSIYINGRQFHSPQGYSLHQLSKLIRKL